jgi:hypothetical protein
VQRGPEVDHVSLLLAGGIEAMEHVLVRASRSRCGQAHRRDGSDTGSAVVVRCRASAMTNPDGRAPAPAAVVL